MRDDDLAEALALALTGRAGATAGPAVGSADALAGLAADGWDAAAIVRHAEAVIDAGGVWPHQVPDELRIRVGSARLFAVLQRIQQDLGLFGRPSAPAAPKELTGDERRLLSDVPPHHGA